MDVAQGVAELRRGGVKAMRGGGIGGGGVTWGLGSGEF